MGKSNRWILIICAGLFVTATWGAIAAINSIPQPMLDALNIHPVALSLHIFAASAVGWVVFQIYYWLHTPTYRRFVIRMSIAIYGMAWAALLSSVTLASIQSLKARVNADGTPRLNAEISLERSEIGGTVAAIVIASMLCGLVLTYLYRLPEPPDKSNTNP